MDIDLAFIKEYLDLYEGTQGILPERLEAFGKTYREHKYLTQEQLYDIAYASSTRSAYHVKSNEPDRCETVTAIVHDLDDDYSQVALLSSLDGFRAPTASCVLAALDPDKHAVVDTRVWASLERGDYLDGRKETFDAEDYVAMIEPIRAIAAGTGYRAVDVGYALFAHDVDERGHSALKI